MESTSRKILEGRKEGGRNHEQKMKFTKEHCEIQNITAVRKIGAELREQHKSPLMWLLPQTGEKDVQNKDMGGPASQSLLKQPAPIGTASRFFGQSQ